jgi:hypothetical protein
MGRKRSDHLANRYPPRISQPSFRPAQRMGLCLSFTKQHFSKVSGVKPFDRNAYDEYHPPIALLVPQRVFHVAPGRISIWFPINQWYGHSEPAWVSSYAIDVRRTAGRNAPLYTGHIVCRNMVLMVAEGIHGSFEVVQSVVRGWKTTLESELTQKLSFLSFTVFQAMTIKGPRVRPPLTLCHSVRILYTFAQETGVW